MVIVISRKNRGEWIREEDQNRLNLSDNPMVAELIQNVMKRQNQTTKESSAALPKSQ